MKYYPNGKRHIGLVAGACYPFDEKYKGYQGNHHFRGVVVKHDVKDGSYDPMFVGLKYIMDRYYKKHPSKKK
jgi:hypothetical protein